MNGIMHSSWLRSRCAVMQWQLTIIFYKKFLIERPLLRALEPHPDGPPVLLIDELDRADEAFEAYLLELLSDWQITIPELGVIAATQPPIVIITSNRTREIHDALKRRCFYHWVDYPDAHLEMAILAEKAPKRRPICNARSLALCRRYASKICSNRPVSLKPSTGHKHWLN